MKIDCVLDSEDELNFQKLKNAEENWFYLLLECCTSYAHSLYNKRSICQAQKLLDNVYQNIYLTFKQHHEACFVL